VPEETPITLNASYSDPGTLDGHTIRWSVVSSNDQAIADGTGSSFTFTPNDDGMYTVTATVTDSDGGVGTTTATITATRVPPTLSLSGPATVDEGGSYTLNLNGQEPGVDQITSWTIHWGDGTVQTVNGNPSTVTHTYAQGPNGYSISAQASDEDGITDAPNALAVQVVAVNVQVVAVNPTLTLSGAATANPLSTYTLNLSATGTDAQTISSWTIHWGDGTTDVVAGNPSAVTHAYALVHRSYTISALTTNDKGTFAAGNTVSLNMSFDTANETFVAQVYLDLLGRAADRPGLQGWTDLLTAGASRADVVGWIMASPEYRTDVVEGLYEAYLGRPADSQGLDQDLQALANGATVDQLKVSILGSQEYFQKHGGTADGFFAALYQDVLKRSGSPSEIQAWLQVQTLQPARDSLALAFLESPEANELLVQDDFQQFLHRDADAGSLNQLVTARAQGATEESVISTLVASDEYFQQAAR
jgi:hypothetical protein